MGGNLTVVLENQTQLIRGQANAVVRHAQARAAICSGMEVKLDRGDVRRRPFEGQRRYPVEPLRVVELPVTSGGLKQSDSDQLRTPQCSAD